MITLRLGLITENIFILMRKEFLVKGVCFLSLGGQNQDRISVDGIG